MNKFENLDGQLSQYALVCGYIQEKRTNKLHVILFQDYGDYQVEAWDIDNPYNRVFRKSFDYSLTEARKQFKSLK